MKRLPNFLLSACVAAMSVAEAAQTAPEAITPVLRDGDIIDYVRIDRPAIQDTRTARDFEDNYSNDLADGLFFAPGVWINAGDIHEPRVSIRGFAVGNRQERSNVAMLRDGAPLTDVHGTNNVQEIDLLSISAIDVFRGGSGDLRFVGDNLGGAINLRSFTGLTTRPGLSVRADAGSSIEGTPGGRIHGDFAGVSVGGGVDYYASLTGLYETGFRDQNERNSGVFSGNIGWRPSENISTRFFLDVARADSELAGGLTPDDADLDPSAAAPPIALGPLFPGGPIIALADGAETDDFGRELFNGRIANQTDFKLFGLDFSFGGHYARRDIESQNIDFIGIIDESGSEWGARLTADRNFQILSMDTAVRFGGSYSTGTQDSDRFENLNGQRGDQQVDTEHNSANVTGFIEAMFKPLKRLVVDLGAKFIMVDRELTDFEDDDFEEERYTGVAARGGLLYNAMENLQLFLNASRTYEPPSMSELLANDPEDLADLEEQDAFTFEAGIRGKHSNWLRWDVTYFNTSVENEIINLDDPETNGLGATLANIESTTHKGFEAGIDINLLPRMTARSGRAITLRSAYSYNDFRFDVADPLDAALNGNRIGGVPQHVYRGELRYEAGDDWFAGLNVQIAGGDYFVDHENLVSAPTYAVLGFSAGLNLNEQLQIFASGENILDTEYAAGLTPVTSQTTQDARIFTPANRASVYAGLKYRF